ncbi:MAG: VCBS repeat-containing protein [Bacteroidetes bacterium]|nr:VCBS repeat-containing protein [Bacteroidota bacterium]
MCYSLRPASIALALALSVAYLHAQIVYIPEITDATIISRTIDVNKPVGLTPGTPGVTSNGAATYTIPLAVPPGTNGVQPQLALAYNSYGGDGLLGLGWSLAGLSMVQRVGSDNYHDGGINAPVKFTTADHFALDGQRLVNISGTYGTTAAVYDTEVAQYAYIKQVGTFGNGPAAFTVVTKGGNTASYGKIDEASAGALVVRSSGSEAIGWLLCEVKDPFGNAMRFIYSDNSLVEAKRIVRIEYTSNPAQGIAAYNTVEFDYNGRTDKTTVFAAGSQIDNGFLLQRIDVKAEGVLMKQYDLKYTKRHQDVSYLAELVEHGVGGASLNTTIFKYGDLLTVQESQTSGTTSVGQNNQYVDLFPGDFDGNGMSDILKAYFYYDGQGIKKHSGFEVYLNGSTTYTYDYAFPVGTLALIERKGGDQQLLFSDVNGDGRDDIVATVMTYDAVNQKYMLSGVQVWQSLSQANDADFTLSSIGIPDNTVKWLYPQSPREFLIPGDFDGDGSAELALFVYSSNWNSHKTYLWRASGPSWTLQNMGTITIDNHFGNGKRINVCDIDGDGKLELMSRNDTYTDQCMIVGMASANTWGLVFSAAAPRADQVIFPGDFNGDGKHDFLIKTNNTTWYINYSTGTGFTTLYPYTMSPTPGANDQVMVGDFSGDGKSDIFLGYYNSATSQWRMSLAYSMGLRSGAPAFELKNFLSPTAIVSLTMGDLNGDGKADLLNRHDYTQPARFLRFNVSTHERRLDKVVDGMGGLADFDYLFLTNPAVYSEETEVFESPDNDFDIPLPLVWKMKVSDGIGGTNTITHTYKDAWGWRNGPGFSGFTKHIVSDAAADRRIEERSAPNPNVAGMFPAGGDVTDISTNTMLSGRAVTGGPYTLGAMRRYEYRMQTSTETDLLASTQVTQENLLWDAYGNVKSARTSTAGILVTETVSPTFGTYGPYPYPSKPATVQVTHTRTGAPAVTATTGYTYSGTTGAVTQMVEFQDKSIKTTTDYLHWPTGNPKQTIVSYTGLATNDRRVNGWTYDTRYRYPVTATKRWNNAGTLVDVTESFTYDPKWGGVLTMLGSDQLQTTYTYDAFGRLASVSAPFIPGTPRYNVTHQLVWDVVPAEQKYYYKLVSDPGGPDVKTWYDLLGREVERQTASFAVNAWAKNNTSYDAAGRVATTTLPRLTGETAQTITNTYDDLGRLQTAANSFSGTTTYGYTYAGGKLTASVTTPASHVSTTTTDATGKTTGAHDDGGDLIYTYDSWGNLLTVVHGSLTQATNTYDVYGRQTKLVDADGGTTEYLYDAFGLLTWQKNANTQVTTLVYDNLGRLKTRTEPEGTTTWTYYYQGGKFIDAPASVVGLGYSLTYDYDEFGRLFQESRAGLGKQYHYDTFDRVDFFQVDQDPMQIQVDYAYTAEGHLNTVKVGTETLFQGLSMNGLGRYKQYTLVDGNTTTVTYDQQYPTRIQAPGVQDLNMAYNYATGNFTYRWDKIKTRKEDFTYDALNRLTGAQANVVNASGAVTTAIANLTYSYDGSVGGITKGNLIQRGDIGKFNYSNAHAPTRAFGTTPGSTAPVAISPYMQTITYSSFLQPVTINEADAGSGQVLTHAYGPDHQRAKSTRWSGSDYPGGPPLEERWYGNGLERQRLDGDPGQDNVMLYVAGGDGICAMIVATRIGGLSQTLYAVYKDHLGSIIAVTRKVNGVVTTVAEQNFDAWGRKRNPATWTYTGLPSTPKWLYRGYTGHEHVEPFGLINMNGRMYDPLNGRMLAVDNYVEATFGTQGLNRYSYAGNNPLKFKDPDGELPHIVIGAAIGGFVNLGVKAWNGQIHGWKDGFKAFGVGAAAGAIGAATGGMAFAAAGGAAGGVGGFWAGAAAGASGAAFSTPVLSYGNTAAFGDPTLTWQEYGISIVAGGVFGGAFNGIAARLNKRDFWNGKLPADQFDNQRIPELLPPPRERSIGSSRGPMNSRGQQALVDFEEPIMTQFDEGPVPSQWSQLRGDLPFSKAQVWRKFGEHYSQMGLTHGQEGYGKYLDIARSVYRDPAIIKSFPMTSNFYRGETWLMRDGILLRLDQSGSFRSLYPIH